MRQHFTGKERDNETGLDFFVNRYYSSAQGRFTSYDPLFVNAKRLADPQRLNLYTYSRNSPLKYIDPNGVDLLLAAKDEEDARKKYALLQKGLTADDRQHTHFVVGDGKNGFAKGAFAVTVDKDYKSDSENFQTLQKIANAKDTEVLRVVSPKEGVTILQMVPRPDGSTALVRVPNVTFTFHGGELNPFAGHTFFPVMTKPDIPFLAYSTTRNSESYVANDTTDEEIVATMYHELRHVVIGDFGRTVAKSFDGIPEVDRQTKAAEDEARKNFRAKP